VARRCLAPPGLPCRQADRDLVLGGYHIAAGTTVWVPFHALHTSRWNWEAAEQYLPERWLPDAGSGGGGESSSSAGGCPFSSAPGEGRAQQLPAASASCAESSSSGGDGASDRAGDGAAASTSGRTVVAKPRQAGSGSFMPYSEGARRCIGQPLAVLELRLALIELLSTFSVELPASRYPQVGLGVMSEACLLPAHCIPSTPPSAPFAEHKQDPAVKSPPGQGGVVDASQTSGASQGLASVAREQRANLTLEPSSGLWCRLTPRAAELTCQLPGVGSTAVMQEV